jgi:hypothetical protein
MKAVLELKKERTDSIFYRYNIDGTLVWFEQYKENGHIYIVWVQTCADLKDDFDFYLQDGSWDENCYPSHVEVNIHHRKLTVEQIDEYISGLLCAKRVAGAIMEIFERSEHKELYESFHAKM